MANQTTTTFKYFENQMWACSTVPDPLYQDLNQLIKEISKQKCKAQEIYFEGYCYHKEGTAEASMNNSSLSRADIMLTVYSLLKEKEDTAISLFYSTLAVITVVGLLMLCLGGSVADFAEKVEKLEKELKATVAGLRERVEKLEKESKV